MYHSMIYIFFDGSGNPPTFMILPHDLFISQRTKKEEDIENKDPAYLMNFLLCQGGKSFLDPLADFSLTSHWPELGRMDAYS